MNIKNLKTYSVPVFRGLDKENKLLKVEPFRAADGKNFIIDSDTLRTRPAVKYTDEIPFVIEENDYVIDWYRFNNVVVWITKNHIYASYKTNPVVNETSSEFVLGIFGNINFEGYEPIFKEEKNALFIFGLNGVFVFSYIKEANGDPHKYVFYSLDKKPVNTFVLDSDYYNQLEKLPSAYEPTLFIGDTRFEDVNLLSNVRKYKTFAATGNVTEGGRQLYYFPTDYDPAKHQGFEYSVDFYEGNYDSIKSVFPIFLGIEGEDFETGSLVDYGSILNPISFIDIENIFYPTQTFEFFGSSTDQSPTVIKNIVDLDRDWFFKSRVLGSTQRDVFSYLVDYISNNDLEGNNNLLVFNVPIEYNAIYKNATTNFIEETIIQRSNATVYVQLKGLDIDSFNLIEENILGSNVLVTQDVENTTYPAYPNTVGTFIDFNLNNDNPILTNQLSLLQFTTAAKDLIRQNRNTLDGNGDLLLNDGDLVRVFGKYYEESSQTDSPSVNVNASTSNWTFFRENTFENKTVLVNQANKTSIQYSSQDPYPSYPSYTSDEDIDLGIKELNDFDQQDFETLANNYLNQNAASFNDGDIVSVKARYFENETQTIPKTATINEQRSTWTYYKNFDFANKENLANVPPTYDFGIDMGVQTSSDQSPDYFETQFENYLTNDKETLRPYIGQRGYLRLTLRDTQTSTQTVDLLNWTLRTGPFPTYIESDIIPVNSSNAKLTFNFMGFTEFTRALEVAGNKSAFFTYDYNVSTTQNTSRIDFDTKYTTFSGIQTFDLPSTDYTTHIKIIIYKDSNSGQSDQNFLISHTDPLYLNTLSYPSSTTTFTTRWYNFDVVDQETFEVDTNVTFGDSSTFPDFLAFDNSGNLPVINGLFVTYNPSNANTFLNESSFVTALDNAITAVVDDISGPASSDAFAKIYVQGTDGTIGDFGTSVVVKFNYTKTGSFEYQWRQSFVMLTEVVNAINEDETIIWDDPTSIDGGNYPTFNNTENYDVVEVPLISQEGTDFIYNSAFLNNIENYILTQVANLSGEPNNQYNGFAKVKVQTEYLTDRKGVSIVIPFTYSKEFTEVTQRRQSMVYTAEVEKDQVSTSINLFDFDYDVIEKRFELRLKDYFYDYNNEPSITLRIEFTKNPDYDLIAKNKFGVSFGSENRLFLAGHPDYPNIDRFNVSNDLLGNNQENQSYELSFFPSKNYRVLGGKGPINGYVTATDSLLYVTKQDYPNDEKLFIRQRILDENGIVGYNEFKTSINKTPLNHKCIVRFNNDIVMLTKDGLYALEISENVLTDERLLKLRSGFINKELIAKVNGYDNDKIFILENNLYMYIFIGQDVYVADSRYTDRNENNIIENLSYEIVYWKLPKTYKTGHLDKNTLKILNETGKFLYTLDQDQNFDENLEKVVQITNTTTFGDSNAFVVPVALQDLVVNPENYTVQFYEGYKLVGKVDTDFTYNNGLVTYVNPTAFRGIENDKTYYFKDSSNNFYPFVVSNSIPMVSFTLPSNTDGDKTAIYESIAEIPLSISTVFTFNSVNYVRLSPYSQSTVLRLTRNTGETDAQYIERLNENFKDYEDYFFKVSGLKDVIINQKEMIEMTWISGISDLGNRLMEKKTYKFNIYATKKENENTITIGYNTRRRAFDETKYDINVSNPNTFKRTSLANYGSTTFRESGFSIPMKENNFLYIQFLIEGVGQVEVNGFDVLYINNRLLKTVA